MHRVAITCGVQPGWVYVRALCGADEESVEGTGTASAIAFLDRLLVAVAGSALGPGQAAELAAADRDRLLAAVYQRELGKRVTSSPACGACGARFDLDFDLAAMLGSLAPDHAGLQRLDDGSFATADGTRFRLPSGADELCAAAAPSPVDALLARCHLGGPSGPETIAAAMERAAPLVDLELDARCPACGTSQAMRFDIQSYFLGSLLAERRQRAAEVHRLARTLGWSLTEILSLTRAQRRLHAELADREMAGR